MDIERVAVTVRPRAGFEAIDLGVRMARSWALPLFGAHGLVLVAVALVAHAVFRENPLAALAAIWWLKPLCDRVALAVLSEAFFGEVPTLAAVLRRLPVLIGRTGLFSALTWQRFSPMRALLLPVAQLEGLRGEVRRARQRVLIARQSGVALAAFSVCALFEGIVLMGLVTFVTFFAPDGAHWAWLQAIAVGDTPVVQLTQSAAYVLAIAFVEPFFVAMGFALYVNRRVWLEGWDLDLAFRKLERRLRARGATSLGLALSLALFGSVASAQAAEPAMLRCEATRPEDASRCLARVLESPEFADEREVETWTWRSAARESPPAMPSFWGQFFGNLFALGLRALVYLALAGVLIALAVVILRRVEFARPKSAPAPESPLARRGLDLRPSALPDDVIAAARACHAAGDAAGALSLLYRGVLVRCVVRRGTCLPASATEGECERLARPLLASDELREFAALTRDWVRVAYARLGVEAADFEAHCRAWGPRISGGSR